MAMGHRQVGSEAGARSRKQGGKAQWEVGQRRRRLRAETQERAGPSLQAPRVWLGSVSAESPTLFTSLVSPDLSLPLLPALGDVSVLLWCQGCAKLPSLWLSCMVSSLLAPSACPNPPDLPTVGPLSGTVSQGALHLANRSQPHCSLCPCPFPAQAPREHLHLRGSAWAPSAQMGGHVLAEAKL